MWACTVSQPSMDSICCSDRRGRQFGPQKGGFEARLSSNWQRTNCNHEVSMKIWVWMLLQNALVAGWREAFFWCLSRQMCKNWSNLIPSLFSSNFSLMTLDDEHPWSSGASQAADWAKWELQASQLRLWFQWRKGVQAAVKRRHPQVGYEMLRIIWIEMKWYIRSAGVYKNSKPFNALTVSQLSRGPSSVMWQVLERIPEAPALLLAGFSTDRRELLDPVQTLRAFKSLNFWVVIGVLMSQVSSFGLVWKYRYHLVI